MEIVDKVAKKRIKISPRHLLYCDLYQLRPPELQAALIWLFANYIHAVLFKWSIKNVNDLIVYYKKAWNNVKDEKIVCKSIENCINENVF